MEIVPKSHYKRRGNQILKVVELRPEIHTETAWLRDVVLIKSL